MDNLVGLIGPYGSGKSLRLFELGIHLANSFRKPLLVNFHLSLEHVRQYCSRFRYHWFLSSGRIIYKDPRKASLVSFLRPDTVVLFDEAGQFINARDWKENSDFYKFLFTLRHDAIHFIYACQYLDQIDKSLRETTQQWVVCSSICLPLRSFKYPYMILRFSYKYDQSAFQMLYFSPDKRYSWFAPLRLSKGIFISACFIGYLLAEFRTFFSILRRYFKYVRYYSKEQMIFRCYSTSGFSRGLKPFNRYLISEDEALKLIIYQVRYIVVVLIRRRLYCVGKS